MDTRCSKTTKITTAPPKGMARYFVRQRPRNRAERQETEALDPALVEIAPLVNAVQGKVQAAVQPQHGVAAEEVAGDWSRHSRAA